MVSGDPPEMVKGGRRSLFLSTAMVAVAGVVLLFAVQAGAGVNEERPEVRTSAPISIVGTQTVGADNGALHHTGSSLPSAFHLEAAEIELYMVWKEGFRTGPPGNQNIGMRVDDNRTQETFQEAVLSLESSEGHPEILVFPTQPDGSQGSSGNDDDPHPSSPAFTIQASGAGAQAVETSVSTFLTRVGDSPAREGANAGPPVGFWYESSSDWIIDRSLTNVRITGNFSIFINNVTATVAQDDETVWENWTGEREEEISPTTVEYRRQLVRLNVTGATLELRAENRLAVLGDVLEVEARGVVSTTDASGRIQAADTDRVFEEEPLRLEGDGNLTVEGMQSSGSASIERLALTIGPNTGFDLFGGQPAVDDAPETLGPQLSDLWPMLVIGALLGGVAIVGRENTVEWYDRWRRHRFETWMERAGDRVDARRFAQAAKFYRKATEIQPDRGIAWYYLALAMFESEGPEATLSLVDEIKEEQVPVDKLDLLELEAHASHDAGRLGRCRRAILQLSRGSPEMAMRVVGDLELDEDELDAELAEQIRRSREPDDLPGYV